MIGKFTFSRCIAIPFSLDLADLPLNVAVALVRRYWSSEGASCRSHDVRHVGPTFVRSSWRQ